MRVIKSLLKALRNTAAFNPDVQAAPACILWSDQHFALADSISCFRNGEESARDPMPK